MDIPPIWGGDTVDVGKILQNLSYNVVSNFRGEPIMLALKRA